MFEQLREQEGEIDRLLRGQARIAHRVIAVIEVVFRDVPRTARTLGDVLTRISAGAGS